MPSSNLKPSGADRTGGKKTNADNAGDVKHLNRSPDH